MLIQEGFQQVVPARLDKTWSNDLALQSLIRRLVPEDVYKTIDDDLQVFQGKIATKIRDLRLKTSEPTTVTQYDQWGRRVDELHTSEGWRGLKRVAAEEGLIAIPSLRREAEFSRVYFFVKNGLFGPEGATVGCPLAMTDGCYRVLELHATEEIKREIMPRLVTTNPDEAWLAAQWMTERPGGSDVSLTETTATPLDPNKKVENGDKFLIDGFKWFSSATDGNVTLALARTGSVESGARGLSLFAIKMRKPDGTLNGIQIHRLKKKWGTKPLPTAELSLKGAVGQLIGPLNQGVRNISSVLNITRMHSASGCTAALGRTLQLAKSFAAVRHIGGVNGTLLHENEMHTTLILEAEITYRALIQLVYNLALLTGKSELSKSNKSEEARLRLLTPVVKAFCARESTIQMLNMMETWGGQGYMAENEFGDLIQDASVERIWEGTSNVLALDVGRVILGTKGAAIQSVIEWANSIVNNSQKSVLAETNQRIFTQDLNLVLSATKLFSAGAVDARIPRRLLYHLAYLASSLYLLEQASWSATTQSKDEHEIDVFVLNKWQQSGGARGAAQDLKELVETDEGLRKSQRLLEKQTVYGTSSKL